MSVSEQIANDVSTLVFKVSKFSFETILKIIKNLNKQVLAAKSKEPKNQLKLKDLTKKDTKLENVELPKGQLRELKKELNKFGVNFSILKNKDENSYFVFFQSKDVNVFDKAFANAVSKFEKRVEVKQNIKKNIEEYSKKILTRQKIKNKTKEEVSL